jgi:hypothetical protein
MMRNCGMFQGTIAAMTPLRARREVLTPPDVGLPWDVEGRGVRGLRREEVARLAGAITA